MVTALTARFCFKNYFFVIYNFLPRRDITAYKSGHAGFCTSTIEIQQQKMYIALPVISDIISLKK